MKVYKKEYSLSPVEFIKLQLYFLINVPVPILNETDITVLAYVHVYKEQARDKIFRDRILTSINSCYNYFSKLKSMNYLEKKEDYFVLNPQMVIEDENFVQIFDIKKDESKSNVNHPYYQG